jgi:hypothetical protein
MAGLSTLTRSDILDAIRACDTAGEAAFIEAHGFGPSRLYRLAYAGHTYPSKAIVGVAAQLTPAAFFGGVAQVVPALQRLGFTVVKNGTPLAPLDLIRAAQAADFDDVATMPPLPAKVAAVFASGANRPGEVRGFAGVGHDVGVAVPELNREAIDALTELAGTDIQVFVDSGAFSEVRFEADGPHVVKPLGPEHWTRVFDVYHELSRALGSQLWLVAPDMVGHQVETLERLTTYAGDIRALAGRGSRVLVPMQLGDRDQADFAYDVEDVLGCRWIPALPCKKAATLPEEVAAFLEDFPTTHVHLLGCGPRNRRLAQYLDGVPSSCTVSLDSNWITANVGRAGKGRRYTRARDAAWAMLGQAASATLVAHLALLIAWGV